MDGLFGDFPEKTFYCLAISEALCNSEDIVLDAALCSGGNLGREACAPALAESEIGLAILEHDFMGHASGIYPPSLEEIHSGVGCKQTVPFSALCPWLKKDSDRDSAELVIIHDIVAFELAAILLHLEILAKLHKGGSREIRMFGMVFCLAVLTDLYHPDPMAFHTATMNETAIYPGPKPG